MKMIEKLKQEIDKRGAAGYKYIYLTNGPGDISKKANCIISPWGDLPGIRQNWEQADDVLRFVQKYPDDIYRVGFARTSRGNIEVVRFGADQGAAVAEKMPIEEKNKDMEEIRGYDQALKDQREIERLKYEVRERDRLISSLEDEIETLENALKEQEVTDMADGTVNLINQVAPLLPALADRFFSLQERKIKALENQSKATAPQFVKPENAPQDYE